VCSHAERGNKVPVRGHSRRESPAAHGPYLVIGAASPEKGLLIPWKRGLQIADFFIAAGVELLDGSLRGVFLVLQFVVTRPVDFFFFAISYPLRFVYAHMEAAVEVIDERF